MKEEKKELEWYDDPGLITTLLIGCLILLLIISQGYAIRHQMGIATIFMTLLNHNITYIIYLVYLILLKTTIGKRSFTGLNLLMSCLYIILFIGSFLNMTSVFNLESIVSFASSFILLCYFTYSFLENTKLYKSLSLDKIPFAKISNNWYFWAFAVLQSVLFILGMIGTIQFDSVVLLLLETIFNIGFARYIYLYQAYKEGKEKEKTVSSPSYDENSVPQDVTTTVTENEGTDIIEQTIVEEIITSSSKDEDIKDATIEEVTKEEVKPKKKPTKTSTKKEDTPAVAPKKRGRPKKNTTESKEK